VVPGGSGGGSGGSVGYLTPAEYYQQSILQNVA